MALYSWRYEEGNSPTAAKGNTMLVRLLDKLWGTSTNESATPPAGPNCDGCGNSTGKPHLYTAPRTRWLCDDCHATATQAWVGSYQRRESDNALQALLDDLR
ncbi:hypothetical protein [Streptomyces sp. NPDC018059]|uniref:hypothetical protein n=1 Tax=Streptomyces sp. NPDC018059 TaxID=3365041 RepID=UPI0037881C11